MAVAAAEQLEQYQFRQLRPDLRVIEGGGETAPSTGSLELAADVEKSKQDYLLGDVDDLARFRNEDGSYAPEAVRSLRQNKITAVQEGAIPYARSNVKHEFIAREERGGLIMDLGRTAVETALRGKLFYQSQEALARADVEVAYAKHNQNTLRPGIAHVMISPRMTLEDGSLETAKAEGLDQTDSLQVNWLNIDESEQPTEAITECILAADIPIQAWVDMLEDGENNIIGKSIVVSNPKSALAVMETHDQIEIPLDKLPEGPITLLASVVPYIQDPVSRQKVQSHLAEFRQADQEELLKRAESPADRWLEFDIATDRSLNIDGIANVEIKEFIDSLKSNWTDSDAAIIERHRTAEGGYLMSRELAALLQKAKENIILTAAAVITGNRKVIEQIDSHVREVIYSSEMAIQDARERGIYYSDTLMLNSIIAGQKVKVGGGCLGINDTFGIPSIPGVEELTAEASKETLSNDRDDLGSRHFQCSKGHWNYRKIPNVKETACKHSGCRGDVGANC